MAHLITGYAGSEHIKSEDQGSFNAAFFGNGQFVMEIGNQFEGSILDNNTVRILDGDLLMYGRHIRIDTDTYEDLTITTGTAGKNRIDLICMTYEKNAVDGTEKAYLQVVQGAESEGTASRPAHTDGNILEGATFNQMPLYVVTVNGVVLTDIEPLFETIPTYKTLAENYKQEFIEACETHLDSLGVLDTMEEVNANTQENQLAGALAVKELYSRIQYHGNYTGDIDELLGINKAGGYWVQASSASGTQPSFTFYFLIVHPETPYVQTAISYATGKIKSRVFTNSQWYSWTVDYLSLGAGSNNALTGDLWLKKTAPHIYLNDTVDSWFIHTWRDSNDIKYFAIYDAVNKVNFLTYNSSTKKLYTTGDIADGSGNTLSNVEAKRKKYIKTEYFSKDNVSIAAGTTVTVDIANTQKTDGYERILMDANVTNASTSGANSSMCNIYAKGLAYTSTGATTGSCVFIRNLGTATAKVRIDVTMVYRFME